MPNYPGTGWTRVPGEPDRKSCLMGDVVDEATVTYINGLWVCDWSVAIDGYNEDGTQANDRDEVAAYFIVRGQAMTSRYLTEIGGDYDEDSTDVRTESDLTDHSTLESARQRMEVILARDISPDLNYEES